MSSDTTSVRLPSRAVTLIDELAQLLGRDHFVVFGGAALDLLMPSSARPKDIDVALPLHPAEISSCLEHLAAQGHEVPSRLRPYWINLDQPVLMADIPWGDLVIDLNFVNEIERIPQFDIESVVWRYPQRDFVDLYGAFRALEARTVRPVWGLAANNPVLLLNRMLRLTAKYHLVLSGHPVHQPIVDELNERIARWRAEDDFHGRQAAEAHHRTVASTMLRASDPVSFLKDVAAAGALRCTLPELHELLRAGHVARELAQAMDAQAFWAAVGSLLPPAQADELQRKLAVATISPAGDLTLPTPMPMAPA